VPTASTAAASTATGTPSTSPEPRNRNVGSRTSTSGSEEGAYTRPPLTTIAPDIGAIAEQAVGLLAGHADERAPTELVTPFSLRVRASTGAADGRR